MAGSFFSHGDQAAQRSKSLMSGNTFSGGACTTAVRSTRKVSGRVAAVSSTPMTSSATMTRIILSILTLRCLPARSLLWLFLRVGLRLLGEAPLLFAQLGRELGAEILGFVERSDLDLGVARHRVRAALYPVDRLLHGLDLPDPVASDQLLGLGERTVD